jgi:hypothetical protein
MHGTVLQVWEWIKDYSGTIVFNPANELKEIPSHSSFFALAPDNRYNVTYHSMHVNSQTLD